MKTIVIFLSASILLITGCVKVLEPTANFDVSKSFVETNEEIEFYNHSNQATDFEWDFGDGFITNLSNPVHHYSNAGIYTVKLSAFNGDLVDFAYFTIKVSTVLNIQVLEYFDKYPVKNASIIIYPTYNDWVNRTNYIIELITDIDGIAEVEGLAPGNYYLDVWEKNHDNYALEKDDIGFIKTPFLAPGEITYFTAYVDYVPGQTATKSATRRSVILSTKAKRVVPEGLNLRKR